MRTEARVIYTALIDQAAIPDMRAIVQPYMFRYPYFRNLWQMLLDAWNSGRELRFQDTMARIKDAEAKRYIVECLTDTVGTFDGEVNARSLRDNFITDKALEHAARLRSLSTEGVTDADRIMAEARSFVSALEGCYTERNAKTVSVAAKELLDKLADVREKLAEGKRSYIPTGFPFLDNWFKGGLRDGNVMVLAARPGVGKTAVLLAMILSMVRFGFKVKMYSMEMPAFELAERIMYSLGGLRPYMMQTGVVDEEKWKKAMKEVLGMNLIIEDSMNNIDDIISDATVAHQQGRCDVIILDHLRLIRGSDPRASIYARTCEITGKLKAFALQQKMPVVYACQLNRDSVREDRDPDLQDLRDSGSIEEDADKIVLLKKIKVAENDFQVKMIIGKHRQGGGAGEHVYLDTNDTYTGFTETKVDRSKEIEPPTKRALDDYINKQNQ